MTKTYKLNNLKLPVDFDKNNLKNIVASKLRLNPQSVLSCVLNRLSLDVRNHADIFYVATVIFECNQKINTKKFSNVLEYFEEPEQKLKYNEVNNQKIVIVGTGPSGLFAGIRLAESGAKVTILERGYSMEKRKSAVDNLMKNGKLDAVSNIQFGEGGAGTFSDGKLNTGIKSNHINYVLKTFHKFGANENILYDAKAHIGTDVLSGVIVNMRNYLQTLGSKVLFEHKLVDINISNGKLQSVVVETPDGKIVLPCDILIMGIGHSSRDTIRMLSDKNMQLKQKPFSMGYRIEHLQSDINKSRFGENYVDLPYAKLLPPADYHLSCHLPNGRGVYTFCMCPGGVVVPAMSEDGTVVTNGMSYSDRAGINSNSAILCSVETSDFPSNDALAGIDLQEKYEKLAFSNLYKNMACVQRIGDFLNHKPTQSLGKVTPTFKPGYVLGDVRKMLPNKIVESIEQGIIELDKKLPGFADPDAILTGVETRSSAPYQVIRNSDMMSSINNVYMIGEGSGFAGGIVSSAVEGIKCADIIISKSIDNCCV